MIAAWLLFSIVVGLVLTLAAAAAERVATAARHPRRFVWAAALAATTLWPAGAAVRVWSGWRGHAASDATAPAALGAIRLPSLATAAPAGSVLARLDEALLVAWAIAAALCAARLLAGVRALRRRRDAWATADVDGVRVRLSADAGPALVGVRATEVVLPEWALALDRPLRALVLRHEEEHRAARDPWLLLGAALLCALFPWQAALWWQARRLGLAIEMDCDARVLRAHPRRDRYALLLLAIAQRRDAGTPHLTPALSEPTSHLERRITAMHSTTRRPSRTRLAASSAVAVAAVAVACSVEPPERPTAPPAPPVAQTSTAPNEGRTFFEFKVQQPARYVAGPSPVYPAALRAAGPTGDVLMQFVVDTAGRVMMSTVRPLRSNNGEFTAAVQRVLSESRFAPAEADGHKVRQLVQMPFTLSPPAK